MSHRSNPIQRRQQSGKAPAPSWIHSRAATPLKATDPSATCALLSHTYDHDNAEDHHWLTAETTWSSC